MQAKIKGKVVEMLLEDFKTLTEELKKCRKDKAELEKANKFLNEQIKEYNEKFAKESNDKN